jgi:hypothetical protein
MKPENILIVSDTEWRSVSNGITKIIEPWSAISGTAIVFFNFEKSLTGLLTGKGKAEYANALIEKEVRSNGAIDGSVKVFVHTAKQQRESLQALYTAVSLDDWQELQNWASQQRDHCVLIPMASLLCAQHKAIKSIRIKDQTDDEGYSVLNEQSSFASQDFGQSSLDMSAASSYSKKNRASRSKRIAGGLASIARACRVGNDIMVFASHQDSLYFSRATLLGQRDEDIGPAAKALAQQLLSDEWGQVVDRLDWLVVCAEAIDHEQTTASYVAQALGLRFRLFKCQQFHGIEGPCFTSLYSLSEELMLQDKSVPILEKLSWMSESWATPVATVAIIASALAVGLGYYFDRAIAEQKSLFKLQTTQINEIQQRVNILSKENTPLLDDPKLAFAAKIADASVYDPMRMLETVKRAAGSNIRIQRVQLFVEDANLKRAYRVEGVATSGANAEIANFVARLKVAGWQATPTRSVDGSIGAFAYIFKPASE